MTAMGFLGLLLCNVQPLMVGDTSEEATQRKPLGTVGAGN